MDTTLNIDQLAAKHSQQMVSETLKMVSGTTNKEKEKKADAFAAKVLKSKEILIDFGKTGRVSEIKIRYCAERLGLHPAIVLGCLQHHGRASYKALHKLKPKASALLPDDSKMK